MQYILFDWSTKEYKGQVFINSLHAQLEADVLNASFPTGTALPRFTVVILKQP